MTTGRQRTSGGAAEGDGYFDPELRRRKCSNFHTCFGSGGSESLMRYATRRPSGLRRNATTVLGRMTPLRLVP